MDHNKNLCEALRSMRESELKRVRNEIHLMLIQLIDETKEVHAQSSDEIVKLTDEMSFLLDSISSRIKSDESFREKIPRNDYISKWKIQDSFSSDDYKRVIRENLDDLIGFRINYYFEGKEKKVYDHVLSFLKKHTERIVDDGIDPKTQEPKKQKNGLSIYKIVCQFKASTGLVYKFELQLKSLIHTLWGEVDHEITYKAKLYDYDYKSKQELLNCIFNSLKSANNQLNEIANYSYTEENFINSLFFLYTHDQIQASLSNKNPTRLYSAFFSIFKKQSEIIKKYVANRMENVPYKPVKYPCNENPQLLKELAECILDHYLLNRFDELKNIYDLLFSADSEQRMSWIVSNEMCSIMKQYWSDGETADEDNSSDSQDFCDDDSGNDEEPNDDKPSSNNKDDVSLLNITEFHLEKESDMIKYIKDASRFNNSEKNILINSIVELCKIVKDM